jgi:uncharacterized protein (TIGR03083 family)
MADRTADLFGSIADGSRAVPNSTWNVGEIGAHLAIVLLGFAHAAGGDFEHVSPYIRSEGTFAERLSGVTGGIMELEPLRDPGELASAIRDRVAQFVTTADRLPGPAPRIATPWYGDGLTLPVATVTSILVAEQLVHGWDVARAVGRPWPISVPEANLALRALTALLPLAANPATVAGVAARYGVTVRPDGPRYTVVVADGAVSIDPGIVGPVDCRISADPVALLLVSYGRIGQWRPIAGGKLRAWGRKPWLAFRFADLFFNP